MHESLLQVGQELPLLSTKKSEKNGPATKRMQVLQLQRLQPRRCYEAETLRNENKNEARKRREV